MILLLLQKALGNEHGHRNILMAVLLEFLIENRLNVLPNGIAVGAHDEQTLYARVIDKLGLGADIGEPLSKVLLHIGYLLNFFLFCHLFFLLYLSGVPLPTYFNLYILYKSSFVVKSRLSSAKKQKILTIVAFLSIIYLLNYMVKLSEVR